MKFRKILIRAMVVMVSLALAAGLIWWRARVSRLSNMPWLNPENHARILAEARINGIVISATDKDGTKYYFTGSTKYMYPMRVEELRHFYRDMWAYSKDLVPEYRGKGSQYQPFKPGPQPYRTWSDGKEVMLGLTPDYVAPGTSLEELMDREKK